MVSWELVILSIFALFLSSCYLASLPLSVLFSRFQKFFCGRKSRMRRRVPIWLSLQSTLTTWATGTLPLHTTTTLYPIHVNTGLVLNSKTAIALFHIQGASAGPFLKWGMSLAWGSVVSSLWQLGWCILAIVKIRCEECMKFKSVVGKIVKWIVQWWI